MDQLRILPYQPSSLLGRDDDICALKMLLQQDHVSLVTLVGPGGVGKSRLAIQVTQEMAERFPDGIVFIPFAHVRQRELVLPTIASAIIGPDLGGAGNRSPMAEILASATDRRILLVLDNLEQIAECGSILMPILAAAPNLVIMATSREALRVSGEHLFEVAPLALPRQLRHGPQLSAEEIARSPAVKLFIERITTQTMTDVSSADFVLTPALASLIAAICQRLDGIPLAIELAAARTGELDPLPLETQLAETLRELTAPDTAFRRRQHGMLQAVQWSYDLLEQEEQHFFDRLSVFTGGFPFEAIPKVMPDTSMDAGVELVMSLVDKSLLATIADPVHGVRIFMLETIRDFALERLQDRGEESMLRVRHALWCLGLADRAFQQKEMWLGSDQLHDVLERELDNLRAARDWAAQSRSGILLARLCYALGDFWHASGRIREGYEWLRRIHEEKYEELLEPALQMRLAYRTGFTARHVGDVVLSAAAYAQMRTLAEELNDRPMVLAAITGLGLTAEISGDEDLAVACFQHALEQHRALDDPRGRAGALVNLGDAEYRQGNLEASRSHSEEAERLADLIGERLIGCLARCNLGQLALASNQLDVAWTIYDDALVRARETRDGFLIADAFAGMADVAIRHREAELASSLLGVTQVLCERFGGVTIPHFGQMNDARSRVEAVLAPETFAHFYAQGETWTIEDALIALQRVSPGRIADADGLNMALPGPEDERPHTMSLERLPGSPGELTEREINVLQLISLGRSDREIGHELFISHRTVMRHVSNILEKLGVGSRLAACTIARRTGLLESDCNEKGKPSLVSVATQSRHCIPGDRTALK